MLRARHAAGVILLIGVAADLAIGASRCGTQNKQIYRRMADLPRGAAMAIGGGMAEYGQSYQRGDVMKPGLPPTRFLRASRAGCTILIDYEQGGFAQGRGTLSLSRIGGVWRRAGSGGK